MPFSLNSDVRFGAAYYAEYKSHVDLDYDFDLMVEAGFTVIRVGESVWSTWEPRNGEFDLDWLEPVLDAAAARGIGVILGTPTYAIPPWLQILHPEIAAELPDGSRVGWGARQEMDQSQPAYRYFAERIVRKVVKRYASHPAVIGFQVDNEPGNVVAHNASTFQGFLAWLRRKYGTVDRLNKEWGLVYWSHQISEWAELWRPAGNLQPQYDLDWRRYQSSLATDLIAWQAEVVREYARDDQFITTCMSYSRPQLADDEMVRSLDITAGNPYYRMQDALTAGEDFPREAEWWHSGVWALFEWADRAWSSKAGPFLVTETNAQSIGHSWQNEPPFPGQIKQAALALVARGARMIEYWHWNSLHFGAETYWGGVLPHSEVPGRIYREVAELGTTLKELGSRISGFQPDSDVVLLYSTDTKWAWEFAPPLSNSDGTPNTFSYLDIFDAHYRGLAETGVQVRVKQISEFLQTEPATLAHTHPVLIAPAVYVADTDVLTRLGEYAAAGGHLVIGVRTGYGDELARARRAVAPAYLSAAAGVHYDEFTNLREPLTVSSVDAAFVAEDEAAVIWWLEKLEVAGASVVAELQTTEFGATAALTTAAYGAGRVSYVAGVPNAALSRSIARWLVQDTASSQWQASSAVTVSTGRSVDHELVFVHNWSGHPSQVTTPFRVREVTTGSIYELGTQVPLEPRAALVFEVLAGPYGPTVPSH
ncbi:beta-galactosidase [Agreia bicolorata]|uniref:beta-galactosidase n=2 Tax=Agreia bicolorata TaxID=110935 RepID=A0A1T4Y3T2_9MICO|nr:beta-galactosidase [Agreia bicolorata]SKA95935.1 beta-galactosidase [Agreia bicolorata]